MTAPADRSPVDDEPGRRRSSPVVRATVGRRAVRSAVVWGALFGALIANEALTYRTNFPTAASRQAFAESFGANGGLAAVIGPGRRLATIEGVVTWRVFGLLVVVGAIWGLLLATRVLRGEEDAGRWELLLAGRTDRRGATTQALAGLAAGFVVLWAVAALGVVAAGSSAGVGFTVTGSLFYATVATASAALFLAVGAVVSQLGRTRRQANTLGALVFGACYLVRMVADGGTGLAWLRWASPLGWIENTRPLTGSQPLALLPVVLLTAALAWLAIELAGRRDVGAGLLARTDAAPARTALLGSPLGLALRLEWGVVLAWALGLTSLAFLFGITARTAAGTDAGGSVEEAVVRLGGRQGGVVAWLGYEFLYLSVLVAFAAAGQISALRNEEAEGHVDHLLARPAGRTTWLAGRLTIAAGLVVLAGVGTAAGAWAGVAGHGGLSATELAQAGANVAVPGLFVLGLGTAVYGLAPRLAAPLLYVVVLWTLLVAIIGPSLTSSQWLLDTAVITHLGPVPASDLSLTATTWLLGLGAVAATLGVAAFNRRDLA